MSQPVINSFCGKCDTFHPYDACRKVAPLPVALPEGCGPDCLRCGEPHAQEDVTRYLDRYARAGKTPTYPKGGFCCDTCVMVTILQWATEDDVDKPAAGGDGGLR